MADEIIGTGPAEAGGQVTQTESTGGDTGNVEGGQMEGGQDAPPPLDPSYVSRATNEFGLAEDDLKTLPRATLDRMFAAADRRQIEAWQRQQQSAQQPYQPPQQAQTPPPAPPAGGFIVKPYEPKFEGEEDADSPIAKHIAGLDKHYATQMEAMHKHYEGQLTQMQQFAAQVQTQQDFALVDRFIDKLGPEWSSVFGSGASLEMDPRSQEFLKRDELKTAAIAAMQAHNRATGKPLPVSEALRRAQYAMFYDKVSAIERAKDEAKRNELRTASSDKPRTAGQAGPSGGIRSRAADLAGMLRR